MVKELIVGDVLQELAGSGAEIIRRQSRAVALRTFGLNHMIHHRAQLGVYLRLLNIPVPGLYGPSADELDR